MKNLMKFSAIIFAFVILFSSCKKDEMSLLNPELTIGGSLTQLTLVDEQLDISGKVAPEDAVDGKVTIKITSEADPTGFEFTVDGTDGNFTDGGVKYLYKSFFSAVYAANYTDASKKFIKVAEAGDNIKVTIGDNVVSKTIKIDCSEILTYSFWSSDATGNIFLNGYNYDGTENKIVEAWSSRDDQLIPLTGEWNDPSQYQAVPNFGTYTFDVTFVDGWSSEENKQIGIYPEGDTLFVKYNSKTYYSIYNESALNGMILY